MERYYKIAGIRIRVTLPDHIPFLGDGALGPFSMESGPYDHELDFRVVCDLSAPDGRMHPLDERKHIYFTQQGIIRYIGAVPGSIEGAVYRIFREGNRSQIQIRMKNIPAGITSSVILNTMEIDHLITEKGGIILHASYIIHKGEAIVFTAPSGTGKSTQAALWERFRGAEVINGDRAILIPTEDCVMVHGLPFSGSSGICKNRSAPLKAIVYLSQAEENRLSRLKGVRNFRSVWEGCNICRWNEQEMGTASDTVIKILNRVPVFHLSCRPDEEAVRTLERVLYQEKGTCI